MQTENVLIGSDPEVFVLQGGVVSSAIGLVPGSKAKPKRTKHGWVQPDNVLAEFNIKPTADKAVFIRDLNLVMQDLKKFVPEISIQASHIYTEQELAEFPASAFEFGCDPDYNAYTGAENKKPESPPPGLRTAGGHIHIGYQVRGKPDYQQQMQIARVCDAVLGLPSVLLDTDTVRKQLYGKAGCFRPKVYGIEYRTLSNFWLKSDALMGWAFDAAQEVVRRADALLPLIDGGLGQVIQDCINNSDKGTALHLCKELGINIPEIK